MTRSPLRIPYFLRALEAVWLTQPDMRFGQLVMNLSREPGGFADTWNWEDSDWYRRMERFDATSGPEPVTPDTREPAA